MLKVHVLYVLHTMFDNGYWSLEQVRSWLDPILDNSDPVPYWVAELACARDASEAEKVILRTINDKNVAIIDEGDRFTVGVTVARYLDGQLSAGEFRYRLLDETDCGEYWDDAYRPFARLLDPRALVTVRSYKRELRVYSKLTRRYIQAVIDTTAINSDADEWIRLDEAPAD